MKIRKRDKKGRFIKEIKNNNLKGWNIRKLELKRYNIKSYELKCWI